MTYVVIYEKGATSWGAYLPDLPGVIAAGESKEEVQTLIRKAALMQISTLRAEGLPVPEPASVAGELEIPR